MFRIGQKVVCVFSNWHTGLYKFVVPTENGVYTIRDIEKRSAQGLTGLRFEEICNPQQQFNDYFGEVAFDAAFFRPLVEKSTDAGMAILREILERESFKGPLVVGRHGVSFGVKTIS